MKRIVQVKKMRLCMVEVEGESEEEIRAKATALENVVSVVRVLPEGSEMVGDLTAMLPAQDKAPEGGKRD